MIAVQHVRGIEGHIRRPYQARAGGDEDFLRLDHPHLAFESGNDDFAGPRPYTPGDPTRAIAWKTLAHEQELRIKRFYGNATAQSWLSWNAVSEARGIEPKLSQLTRWVLDAAHTGVSFSLELPDRRIELGQGTAHRDQCLHALALFEGP